MKSSLRAVLVAATVIAAAPASAQMSEDRNIVENAGNSAEHTTLVAALQAAYLADWLQGVGPFTVFAPTNAAFDALPEGRLEELLTPENAETLHEVMTCHVMDAIVMSDAIDRMIADGDGVHVIETLGGCMLELRATDDMITLTDEAGVTATVTTANVGQSNGVLHVIDAVIHPGDGANTVEASRVAAENAMAGGTTMSATMSIVETAGNSADHTTLIAALQAAYLVDWLQGEGPFTVFAPTNAGFDALPEGTVETLLMEENREALIRILTSHVVAGRVSAADLRSLARAAPDGFHHFNAISGAALSAQVLLSGTVFIFDESGKAYRVSAADMDQSNGVIHVVDGVLMPR